MWMEWKSGAGIGVDAFGNKKTINGKEIKTKLAADQ